MGATAKKGATALMRRSMAELKKSVRNYDGALTEWRLVRKRMAEYKRYRKAKEKMRKSRERFGALWDQLPREVQEELGREFWPKLDNFHEAFDHNSLPVYLEGVRIFGGKKI